MRTHPPAPPGDDLRFSNTTGILQKKTMWFIDVEVEQETSAPPPKINPGSAPVIQVCLLALSAVWAEIRGLNEFSSLTHSLLPLFQHR